MMSSMVIVLVGLLMFAIPIGLIAWLVVALSRKSTSSKKSEVPADFEKGLRLFYMYAVMLVMLFTLVGCTIAAVTAIGDILFPEVAWEYALKTLVPAMVGMAISIPIFAYHFRQTKEQ